MENKTYEFLAEIKQVPGIDGAYIEFPYDLRKEFGKGRIKVYAQFDGEPYTGSIVNMGLKNNDGTICYIIGIKKDIRKKINKKFGDKINVKIREREK
jgi:hypothetical protein